MRRSRIWLLLGGIAAAAIVLTLSRIPSASAPSNAGEVMHPVAIHPPTAPSAEPTAFLEPALIEAKPRHVVAPDADPDPSLIVRVVRAEDGVPIDGIEVEARVGIGSASSVKTGRTNDAGCIAFDAPQASLVRLRAEGAGRQALRVELPHRRDVSLTANTHDSVAVGDIARGDIAPREIVLRMVVERSVLVRLVDGAGQTLRDDSPGMNAQIAQCLHIVVAEDCASYGSIAPPAARQRPTAQLFDGPVEDRDVHETCLDGIPALPTSAPLADRSQLHPDDPQSFAWRMTVLGVQPLCVHALLGSQVVAKQQLEPGALGVDLSISRTALEGIARPLGLRVVGDADGEPIPGARVAYTDFGNRTMQTTNGEGRVRIETFYGVDGRLTVTCAGYETLECSIDRGNRNEFELRLRFGRIVEGLALDVTGKPLTRGRVELLAVAEAGAKRAGEALCVVDTNREGRFRFADVAPGTYVVEVSSLDAGVVRAGDSSVPVDCRLGSVHDVVVRRPPRSDRRPRQSWTDHLNHRFRDWR